MNSLGLLEKLRATSNSERLVSFGSFLAELREIQSSFRNLTRSLENVDELIAMKYRMQHWREKIFTLALEYLEMRPASGSSDELVAIRILAELEFKPEPRRLAGWLSRVKKSQNKQLIAAAAHYLAVIAEPKLLDQLDPEDTSGKLRRSAGPARKLPILANAPSRCIFSKWSQDAEFSNHEIDEEHSEPVVHYRGMAFLAGDLLVSNVNRDGNGVYTALQSPRSYGYHLGVFAILSVEGRRIPAVIESYKLGVRAVPLSTFLSPDFNSYVEVCRLRTKPEGFHLRLNAHAADLSEKVKGYNFDTEDPDRSYLACPTVATRLYELAGVQPISTKSRYIEEPQVKRNMEVFDFGVAAFLSLTDFLIDERIQVIGAIDNGHFHRNVARELCERQFVQIFRSGDLDVRELPFMFNLNRFGVRQMRAGTLLGTVIGIPYGLTQQNLPRGPEKVLAVIEIYEHLIESAVGHADRTLRAVWDTNELVDIDKLAEDPAVTSLFERSLRPIARAFRPAREPEQALALH